MTILKTVLFDLDNSIMDFGGRLEEIFAKEFPFVKFPLPHERTTLYVDEQIKDPEHRRLVPMVVARKGFFLDMLPIPGAIEAVRKISSLKNVNLVVCTSPLKIVGWSVEEKYESVTRWLGSEYAEKMIVTRDKTLVSGLVLVDDNPKIEGANPSPTWKQVTVRQPYNLNCGLETIHFDSYDGYKDFYEWLKYD